MHSQVLKKRYHLLDELRGFMVLCMVIYHGFLSVDMALGGSNVALKLFDFFTPAEPLFAGGFILLSGICCNFSRSNLKRGLILLSIALGLNAITIIGQNHFGFSGIAIYFGILNLLSFCMIFVGVFNKPLSKINAKVGIIIFLILFILAYIFIAKLDGEYFLVDSEYFYMFGFPSYTFYSADYFPILPWLFLFIVGFYIGKTNIFIKYEKFFSKKCKIPFRFLGKYAIIIYVLHQPIIYGVAYLIGSIIYG